MRILAAADVHGYTGVYHWLVAQARAHDVDALVLAGDLLGIPDEYEDIEEGMRASGREIVSILAPLECPILYILGNDDLVDLLAGASTLRPLHGQRVEYQDLAFVGYACGPYFVHGPLERGRAEMDRELAALRSCMDERTVFVTHYPAAGIADGGGSGGLLGLRVFLQDCPFLVHIHGHVHRAFGREGRHFNVASAAQKRAMIIELPSSRHTVLGGG
jgi:Icc-related predicted phosphoesterase